ncbi:hypothetical protein SNE40_011046 [Patella caerulea]|uniref:Uncharacterized protein n=1 Tax=Patella caerulea TaxID=87958 RepID=A0AAN8PTE8_PATCE
MPVVFLSVPQPHNQFVLYVVEKESGADYCQLMSLGEKIGLFSTCSVTNSCVSQENLKLLQSLASSEKDRRLIKYAVTAQMSGNEVRKCYGIADHRLKCSQVEEAMTNAYAIQTAYMRLAKTHDRALLEAYNLNATDDSGDTPKEDVTYDSESYQLEDDDFVLYIDTAESEQEDDPDEWQSIKSVSDQLFRNKVIKRRKYLRDKASRLAARKIAEERILKRQVSTTTSSILSRHPNIGALIEEEVKAAGVGADKWRSSGSLTWERHKVGQKMTFEKLRKKNSERINETISHGTMVELCVPRNGRHKNSSRYKSVAHVVSKRARKGFDIKVNVDEKWSNSLYSSLNAMQLENHDNIFYLNRDDASGFRMDTLATSSKFPSLMVQNAADLATRTDFTNKEQSVLQVSSYAFTAAAFWAPR